MSARLRFAALLALAAAAAASLSRADVIVEQNFNSAPSVASLIDPDASDTSRFNDISSFAANVTGFDALPGHITPEQVLPGISSVSLSGGKLVFSLLSAWRTYFNPLSELPEMRRRDHIPSRGEIVRIFPPGSRPTLFLWKFKLETSSAPLSDANVFLHPSTIQIQAGKNLAAFAPDGSNRIRRGSQVFSGNVQFTVAINKTGEPAAYQAPDGSTATVGASRYDLWANSTLVVDEGEHLASDVLGTAGLRFTVGIGNQVQDLGGGNFQISTDRGPAFVFSLDDVVMRSSFAAPPQTPSIRTLALSGNLNFGRKRVGSRSRKTFLVRNTGNAPVQVRQVRHSNAVFSGAFAGTLAPGAGRSVAVTFRPRAPRRYQGSLSVLSNATNSPTRLAQRGDGVR
jgi:hypothetical protein